MSDKRPPPSVARLVAGELGRRLGPRPAADHDRRLGKTLDPLRHEADSVRKENAVLRAELAACRQFLEINPDGSEGTRLRHELIGRIGETLRTCSDADAARLLATARALADLRGTPPPSGDDSGHGKLAVFRRRRRPQR